MSIGGRLQVLSKWFGTPSPEGVRDWRLSQWRANYDEARTIARYVRVMAQRGAAPGSSGTRGQS